jgi:pimeloyl-ACP methyl ester carboxylesterase
VSRVVVGRATVAYEVQGEGDPVVLLHGSTGGRRHWILVAPFMAQHHQLVLLDYAGGTETTDRGGPLDLDELVDEVLGVADAESIDRFHIAGWSLGGVVAAAAAARAPDRVRSAALVCSWVTTDAYLRFENDLWAELLAKDRALFSRYVLQAGFTSEWFNAIGDAVDLMVEMGTASLSPEAERHRELNRRIDLSSRLSKISSPTLVIGCSRDVIVPFGHSRALSESISGSQLVEFDCGHFLPLEMPEKLAETLIDFFTNH